MEKGTRYYQAQIEGVGREADQGQVFRIRPKKPLWIDGYGDHPVEAMSPFTAEKLPEEKTKYRMKRFRALLDVEVRKRGGDNFTMETNTIFATFAANATKIEVKV